MITSHARREKRAIDKATAADQEALEHSSRALFYALRKPLSQVKRFGGREREGGKTQPREGNLRKRSSNRSCKECKERKEEKRRKMLRNLEQVRESKRESEEARE